MPQKKGVVRKLQVFRVSLPSLLGGGFMTVKFRNGGTALALVETVLHKIRIRKGQSTPSAALFRLRKTDTSELLEPKSRLRGGGGFSMTICPAVYTWSERRLQQHLHDHCGGEAPTLTPEELETERLRQAQEEVAARAREEQRERVARATKEREEREKQEKERREKVEQAETDAKLGWVSDDEDYADDQSMADLSATEWLGKAEEKCTAWLERRNTRLLMAVYGGLSGPSDVPRLRVDVDRLLPLPRRVVQEGKEAGGRKGVVHVSGRSSLKSRSSLSHGAGSSSSRNSRSSRSSSRSRRSTSRRGSTEASAFAVAVVGLVGAVAKAGDDSLFLLYSALQQERAVHADLLAQCERKDQREMQRDSMAVPLSPPPSPPHHSVSMSLDLSPPPTPPSEPSSAPPSLPPSPPSENRGSPRNYFSRQKGPKQLADASVHESLSPPKKKLGLLGMFTRSFRHLGNQDWSDEDEDEDEDDDDDSDDADDFLTQYRDMFGTDPGDLGHPILLEPPGG